MILYTLDQIYNIAYQNHKNFITPSFSDGEITTKIDKIKALRNAILDIDGNKSLGLKAAKDIVEAFYDHSLPSSIIYTIGQILDRDGFEYIIHQDKIDEKWLVLYTDGYTNKYYEVSSRQEGENIEKFLKETLEGSNTRVVKIS